MLSTQHLSLHRAHKCLFTDLSVSIKAGEVWGMLGENGCGKTTLLHTLGGLYPPTSGQVRMNDHLLDNYSIKDMARHVGILFQEIRFEFAESVFEFCLSGRHPFMSSLSWLSAADKAKVLQALEQFNLLDKKDHCVFNLSGGEKRRLNLATLYTQDPRIYLLDEPTNHLDLPHQIKLFALLKNMSVENNISVIMATHDVNLVSRYCTHVILFQAGKLVYGPVAEVLSAENLFDTFHHPFDEGMIAGNTVWQPHLS